MLTRDKFRVLLVYLKRYLQLWGMFVAMDRDGDRRLTPDELEQALPKLQKWGFAVNDSREVFEEMDENAGGYILFDEFADWAIRRSLGVLAHLLSAPGPAPKAAYEPSGQLDMSVLQHPSL